MHFVHCVLFFFFKQKTAYEMRISDWSSDVCSSDLLPPLRVAGLLEAARGALAQLSDAEMLVTRLEAYPERDTAFAMARATSRDRKSVVEGKGVSVRVDLGGRRIIKKKNRKERTTCKWKTNKRRNKEIKKHKT